MMKLYIKQKVFSWGDKFTVYDENENVCFTVEGEVFTLGKKLHIYDSEGREQAFVSQKLLSFLPRFFIFRNGTEVLEVKKELTFFHKEYTVSPLGWKVSGDFFAHEYEIENSEGRVASISKKWFTWGDTYEIDIMKNVESVIVLSVVLVIDAVLEMEQASNH